MLTIATKYPSALGIIYHLVNLHACASPWDGHLITVTVSVSSLLLLRDTRLLICQINHTMEMKAESQHRAEPWRTHQSKCHLVSLMTTLIGSRSMAPLFSHLQLHMFVMNISLSSFTLSIGGRDSRELTLKRST